MYSLLGRYHIGSVILQWEVSIPGIVPGNVMLNH